MNNQNYSINFAKFYHHHIGDFSIKLAKYYHKKYLNRIFGNKRIQILDIMCGTGEFLNYFFDLNFICSGLDLSPDMISIAKKANPLINYKVGNALNLNNYFNNTTFDVITCNSDALNHISSISDIKKIFRQVYHLLSDNGILIFDINTKKGIYNNEGVSVANLNPGTVTRVGAVNPEFSMGCTYFWGNFQENESNQILEFRSVINNYIYNVQDFCDILTNIGFYYKICDLETFPEKCINPEKKDRIIFIVQKSKK